MFCWVAEYLKNKNKNKKVECAKGKFHKISLENK